jgi:hypothetical protein
MIHLHQQTIFLVPAFFNSDFDTFLEHKTKLFLQTQLVAEETILAGSISLIPIPPYYYQLLIYRQYCVSKFNL